MDNIQRRFNISIPQKVEFIRLRKRHLVEADRYPHFTLLGQSVGSMFLAWEALSLFVPDVYIDSTGYAFSAPVFHTFGQCKTVCYVHYPTISTDMLSRVKNRVDTYNNPSLVSKSLVFTGLKLIYYKMFAWLYAVVGNQFQIVMVNSSWTQGHINTLWECTSKVVYPPCDVHKFSKLPLKSGSRDRTVVSVGQFRPEKDHKLQIESFHAFLGKLPSPDRSNYKLVLAGGCRNEDDLRRIDALKQLCSQLSITDQVQFELNIDFEKMLDLLGNATIGLHTMWNEHFGICVVELMAAGTIVLGIYKIDNPTQ